MVLLHLKARHYIRKTTLPKRKGDRFFDSLFSFKAVATSATFCVARTGIPHMDLAQGAIIPSAVVLTFGYAAADGGVYVVTFFIHHNKNPPSKVKAV